MAIEENGDKSDLLPMKSEFNLAIVGGGRSARTFMKILNDESFPYINFNVVGLCDINPEAEGFLLAQEMGIYTVSDYRGLFKIRGLDAIIEMTGDRKVLVELSKNVPEGLGIIEKNMALTLMKFIAMNEKQIASEQKAIFEKISSAMLLRQTNASILILNTDFTIYDVNEAFLSQFKKAKKDVLGKLCYKITRGHGTVCPYDKPEFRCPMVQTLKTGESAFVIQEFPISEERTIYCNTVTYPLKDPDGNIVRIIELRRNVTEEISSKWEKRIRDLKANMKMTIQEDRMISLGKLVASCVHEINNPIQGMLTFSHLMQDMVNDGLSGKGDLEKFKRFLSLMSKELERCGEIVSGLLSFSRESPMEYRNVSINDVLESVIVLIHHKCELQKIHVKTKISQKKLMVQGDTNQLQQCFLNLIFNAIEAMKNGGRLTVVLKPVKGKNLAQVEVRDTGHGISERNLDHIFDPFFTTKNEGEGTGLGLSIVYGVAKNHGGNIKVDSRQGKGTSFILTLPVSNS